MAEKEKAIIGSNTFIDLIGYARHVPAKVDTGADSSSIWVSDVRVDKDGVLKFRLFGEGSSFYTGKTIKREKYKVALVRSASGHEQLRYRTQLSVRINNRRIRALFNLSDRSKNQFPILVGRRTLSGKFIVDVAESHYNTIKQLPSRRLMTRMHEDPYKFYKQYYQKSGVSLRKKS